MTNQNIYMKFTDEKANILANTIYSTKENYEIQKTNGDPNRIIIFFTGHGLYYPNTYEQFNKEVVVKDKYEWKRIAQNPRISGLAGEMVFVRDIYKIWCIRGVNSSINSQDKLVDVLKKIANGRRVTTVGSSAGGYMAILFGVLLNADSIYAFSPQVNLHEYHKDHKIEDYDIYVNTSKIAKYMDLVPLIRGYKGHIFYWYPARCVEDIRQYDAAVPCENISFFAMDQSEHGATLWGESIIRTLELPTGKLNELCDKYANKIVKPATYCKDTSGYIKSLIILLYKRLKNC